MKDIISENIIIASGKFDKEKEYWLNKLSGEQTLSRFPFVRRTSTTSRKRRENLGFRFPGDIYNQLNCISNKSDFGIFIILTTGISYLLGKYTGNDDIIIGTPVFKQAIPGEYINNFLVLRNRVIGDMTFKALLLQVKRTVMEANENMNYPLEKIYQMLGVIEDGNGSQLFNTLVIFDNIQDKAFARENKCDIVFSFHKTDGNIECEVTYDSLLYSNGFIHSLGCHLVNFFKIALGEPGRKLSGIDVLSGVEKQKLLHDFNNTQVDYPREKSLQQLFEEQVEKSPDVLAVFFEDYQLTFRQLNETANQMAGMLAAKGIQMEDIVGLMVKRSMEMVIGYIGILKANAVVLPIDVDYPIKRIYTILKDSGAGYILKQKELGYLPGFQGVTIGSDHEQRDKYSTTNPNLVSSSRALAIVIYTSGSTGKPKGVILHHTGVINHIFTKIDVVGLGKEDVCCHNLNIGFVASIWQIFAPFFKGAGLYIYPLDILMDAYKLFSQVRKHNVTVLEVVPSFLNAYFKAVEAGNPKVNLKGIRTLLLTGEKVEPSLVNLFFKDYKIDLVNAYGQSECSDDTLHYKIPHNTGTMVVPLGRPSNNTRIYILDKNNQLQPWGVPGELYIWGDGLASGYLNQPALTQKKFMSNPFLPGERMFKTGDFARWLPDGNIEFMGRIDSQVKIRGHRIELGEIESQLLTNGQIKQAIVVPRENKKGNKYLCAYFVSDVPCSAADLREHLARELPGYMIPSYFVPLVKIPLNPNGKIDRKSLPLPERFGGKGEYAAPRDKLEHTLVKIFQEFYVLDKVGIYDNFFDLGATSLDLIQINSKVKKMLGREISIILFFEYPTIAALSGYLQGKENELSKNVIDSDGIIDKGKSKLRQLKKKVNDAGSLE